MRDRRPPDVGVAPSANQSAGILWTVQLGHTEHQTAPSTKTFTATPELEVTAQANDMNGMVTTTQTVAS